MLNLGSPSIASSESCGVITGDVPPSLSAADGRLERVSIGWTVASESSVVKSWGTAWSEVYHV
jgi:hypothetical protein